MGLLLGTSSRSVSQLKIVDKPTLFESSLDLAFTTIDVPGNVFRSLVFAAQNPKEAPKSVLNAIKTIIPFVPSERIGGDRLTGSDDFWLNLAVEFITDPLIIVGGAFTRTIVGQSLRKLSVARKTLEAAKAAKRTEFIPKLAKEVKRAQRDVSRTIARRPQELRGRSFIKLNIPFTKPELAIGDFDAFIAKMATRKDKIFPSVKRIALEDELLASQLQKTRLVDKGKFTTTVDKKILALQRELKTTSSGIVSKRFTTGLREFAKSTRAKFAHGSRDLVVEAGRDLTEIATRRAERLLKTKGALALANLKEIAEIRKVSDINQMARLMELSERRFLIGGIESMSLKEFTKAGDSLVAAFKMKDGSIIKTGNIHDLPKHLNASDIAESGFTVNGKFLTREEASKFGRGRFAEDIFGPLEEPPSITLQALRSGAGGIGKVDDIVSKKFFAEVGELKGQLKDNIRKLEDDLGSV